MMTPLNTPSGETHGKYGFCSEVVLAVAGLKDRLRDHYENRFPQNSALIHSTIDAAVALAWETRVPHLVLPELVAEKIRRLAKSSALHVAGESPALAHAA